MTRLVKEGSPVSFIAGIVFETIHHYFYLEVIVFKEVCCCVFVHLTGLLLR